MTGLMEAGDGYETGQRARIARAWSRLTDRHDPNLAGSTPHMKAQRELRESIAKARSDLTDCYDPKL